MHRQTNTVQLTHSERERSPHRRHVTEMEPLSGSLKLACGKCGALANYRVGAVSVNSDYFDDRAPRSQSDDPIDPDEVARDNAKFDAHVGFTHYFRCRDCNAGGPWMLTPHARMRVRALLIAKLFGREDTGVYIASQKLYDGTDILYPTQAEDIFRERIAKSPENDMLWMRLGNVLRSAGRPDLARPAYEKCLALNPLNLDSHVMLAQLLEEKNAPRKAYEHWKGALRAARYAIDIPRQERLEAVSTALDRTLELAKDPQEVFELLPMAEPDGSGAEDSGEPRIVHLFDFDLSNPSDWERVCRAFLGEPTHTRAELRARERAAGLPRSGPAISANPPGSRPERNLRALTAAPPYDELDLPPDDDVLEPVILGPRVGRNDPCPCGSDKKHKKCCGR